MYGINPNLFDKYKEMKVVSDGTLFGVEPIIAIQHRACPYCFCKLYLMRNNKFYYCKSVKHKKRFVISKAKMDF